MTHPARALLLLIGLSATAACSGFAGTCVLDPCLDSVSLTLEIESELEPGDYRVELLEERELVCTFVVSDACAHASGRCLTGCDVGVFGFVKDDGSISLSLTDAHPASIDVIVSLEGDEPLVETTITPQYNSSGEPELADEDEEGCTQTCVSAQASVAL